MKWENVNENEFKWEEVEPVNTFRWLYWKPDETKDLRGWLVNLDYETFENNRKSLVAEMIIDYLNGQELEEPERVKFICPVDLKVKLKAIDPLQYNQWYLWIIYEKDETTENGNIRKVFNVKKARRIMPSEFDTDEDVTVDIS